MSIEAMKRIKSLLQDTKMIDSHTISAVVAECDMAILAQQPATGEPHPPFRDCGCADCLPSFSDEPTTPEPVQADSSEHLRVIASLGAALRRLSFAAQTTGGTDGPDAELQSAIGQAEQALSLGGIWKAMSATGEPVAWLSTDSIGERHLCFAKPTNDINAKPLVHPAPSVLDVDFELQELREIERAMDDFADCGETDVVDTLLLRAVQAGFLECTHFHVANRGALQEAIDAAILAAKKTSA